MTILILCLHTLCRSLICDLYICFTVFTVASQHYDEHQLGTSSIGIIDRKIIQGTDTSSKGNSRVSSAICTPRSQPRSGPQTPSYRSCERSVRYYFQKLKSHFTEKNNMQRWGLTYTRYLCIIYDGNKEKYKVEFEGPYDSAPVRNLYLMLHSCQYNVEDFLKKLGEGEFQDFSGRDSAGNRLVTPPEYRGNVFFLGK